jgi:hypothetical protein
MIELHTSIGIRRHYTGFTRHPYNLELRCTQLEEFTSKHVFMLRQHYQNLHVTILRVYVHHQSRLNHIKPTEI